MSRISMLLFAMAMVVGGCKDESSAAKAALPAPIVTVSTPIRAVVPRYEYFTGRVEAPDKVEIRAKVSGYLVGIKFEPGTVVEKGKPLFEIDPDPFKVALQKAEASLALSTAREKQTAAELKRLQELKGAASASELDKGVANELEAAAAIKSAEALVADAKLNLGYCSIVAPFTGMVGDKLVSEGNLIAGGTGVTTLLTTIVSIETMDIAFDADENTMQRFQAAERAGAIKSAERGKFAVGVGLSIHGADYPLTGLINFTNNVVDAKTGTYRIKANVPNPSPPTGKRLMTPGMFARVRVPFGDPVDSMLVPEAAMMSDLGNKFLYSLGADNKAIRLEMIAGITTNGNVVVESVRDPGSDKPRPLRADEKIIVSGVQRVRPGMVVDPKPASK